MTAIEHSTRHFAVVAAGLQTGSFSRCFLYVCCGRFSRLFRFFFVPAGRLRPTFFGFWWHSHSWLCSFICFRVAVLFSRP
jgi:hypothetical protein